MLPIELSTLSLLCVVGDIRVLSNPERTAFRVEPNAAEHEIARPIADLFFGQSDAIVSISDAALQAILAARDALPKAEPKTDEEVLAEFNKLADELAAVEKERNALDDRLADLEKARVSDAAALAKLEMDLADARSRIPVVAPSPDKTPPIGTSTV